MLYFKILFVLAVINFVRFIIDFFKNNSGKKLTEISKASLIMLGVTAVYSFMVCSICISPASFFRTVFFKW